MEEHVTETHTSDNTKTKSDTQHVMSGKPTSINRFNTSTRNLDEELDNVARSVYQDLKLQTDMLKEMCEKNEEYNRRMHNGTLQHLLDIESTLDDFTGCIDDFCESLKDQNESFQQLTLCKIDAHVNDIKRTIKDTYTKTDEKVNLLMKLVWALTIISAGLTGSAITVIITGVLL